MEKDGFSSHKEHDEFSLADFYEELGKKYPEEQLTYISLEAKIRKKFLISKLRELEGTLLDAGCNTGIYCVEYKNGPIIGVDISPSLIDIAKRRIPQGTFFVGDISDIPLISSLSIDNILCTEVLEHIPNPIPCIKEFFRVLKPNGVLIVTVPHLANGKRPTWKKKTEMQAYGIKPIEYFHTAYKLNELISMVNDNGFLVVEADTIGHEVVFAERKLPKWVFLVKKLLIKIGLSSLARRLVYCCQILILVFYRHLTKTKQFEEIIERGPIAYIKAVKQA